MTDYAPPMSSATTRRPYAARMPLEERREQLLDAALTVIGRDGYEGVSVDSIAREASVTRPVVYGAFEGLGDLLTTLLDRQQARAFGRLLAAFPETPDFSNPTEFVSVSVRHLAAVLRDDPEMWRPILLAPEGMPDAVRMRIEADKDRIRMLFAAWISAVQAQRAGPVLDAEVLAHAILAIVEHFGRVLLIDPGKFDDERLVDAARGLLSALWA